MRQLSRGAQAARSNGYGTLKNFRAVAAAKTYAIAARQYDLKHGLARGSSLKSTSKFAKDFGKAFYKDGNLRKPKDVPPSYLAKLQRDTQLGRALSSATSFENY
jgi:hypothetical protein